MDEKEESCCTIDYEHHKEIFEKRRRGFLKDPDKAVTTHQAKIRLIRDHYREAKVPRRLRHRVRRASGAGRNGCRPLTAEPVDAVCVIAC